MSDAKFYALSTALSYIDESRQKAEDDLLSLASAALCDWNEIEAPHIINGPFIQLPTLVWTMEITSKVWKNIEFSMLFNLTINPAKVQNGNDIRYNYDSYNLYFHLMDKYAVFTGVSDYNDRTNGHCIFTRERANALIELIDSRRQ